MQATVAIVGRPNVGKSTLFNRLVGRRQAIVHDQPGVTRDRVVGSLELADERHVELIDTGGLVPGDDPIGLNAQVRLAVEESDLLVMVVDGREGLVPGDQEVWHELRRYGKPALLAVNKGDTRAAQEGFEEFYQLGVGQQVLVSAEHGRGVGDLLDLVAEELNAVLGEPGASTDRSTTTPALAIVGRPNVGKSSILNRLVRAPRSLVSPVAGTTRDPVDTLLERDGERDWMLVDTAGIRRRSQVSGAAEDLAVMMAKRQIDRADVVVLVVDASSGITSSDLAIAGAIWEAGRSAVIAVNKWDLLKPPAEEDAIESENSQRNELEDSWERLEEILYKPPRVNVSALTGRGLEKLLPAADQVYRNHRTELGTSEVNRLFEEAVARNQAPAYKGRPWNLLYATQVSTGPPTFMVFASRTLPRQNSYRRYLENQLRSRLGLPGVPIRLVIRARQR